jgi:nucleotide-binding universal stress UspA family protein
MLRRLLVPLDGSPLAERALPLVEQLARLTDARVNLLLAVDRLDWLPETTLSVVVDRQQEQARARHAAGRYLEAVAQRLRDDGLSVTVQLAATPPSTAIVEASDQADLIIMTTHGRTGLGRWTLGSVADKVVRSSERPVLLLRPETAAIAGDRPLHRLLVPLDGSPLAEQALPLARLLAGAAGASLYLLHGFGWPIDITRSLAYLEPIGGEALMEADRQRLVAYLETTAEPLRAAGLTVVTNLRDQAAAEAIVAEVAEQAIDLIVMTTHGRGGVSRWFLGSVADRLLHGAPVPLLLLRAVVPPA